MPCPIQENVDLSARTTIGLGGCAQYFAVASSVQEVKDCLVFAKNEGLPLSILGGGSNLVIADGGVAGLVLVVDLKGIELGADGSVWAGAGENWDEFTAQMCAAGYFGVECLGGIPGSLGSTPIQNVGAYGQEVSQTIVRVDVLSRATLEEKSLTPAECAFAYRDSYFKRNPQEYVVLGVQFQLSRVGAAPRNGELATSLAEAEAPTASDIRSRVIELRRKKSMVVDPSDPNSRSCGSFFVNCCVNATTLERIEAVVGERPPAFAQEDGLFKVPSAWLIERAGFEKGYRRGNVGLSEKHCLALIAKEGAQAADLLGLAGSIQRAVEEQFGVRLEAEPRMWGFSEEEVGYPLGAAIQRERCAP